MTAERLREAADVLAGFEGVTRSLLVIGHRSIDVDEIAALLRAIADNCDNGTDRLSTTVTAAEQLADAVLGGES